MYGTQLELYEVIYISVFIVAVMVGIFWYTLYGQIASVKWNFIILGCITALVFRLWEDAQAIIRTMVKMP